MKEADLIAFVRLVHTMRKTQKEYFRTRETDTLKQSKALEKRVDETTVTLMNQYYNENSQLPFISNIKKDI